MQNYIKKVLTMTVTALVFIFSTCITASASEITSTENNYIKLTQYTSTLSSQNQAYATISNKSGSGNYMSVSVSIKYMRTVNTINPITDTLLDNSSNYGITNTVISGTAYAAKSSRNYSYAVGDIYNTSYRQSKVLSSISSVVVF